LIFVRDPFTTYFTTYLFDHGRLVSCYCTLISFLDAACSRSTHRLADLQSSPSVFAFFTCALRFVTPYVIYGRTCSNLTLDIVSCLFRSAINIVFAFFTCALRHCILSIQTNPARLFYFRLTVVVRSTISSWECLGHMYVGISPAHTPNPDNDISQVYVSLLVVATMFAPLGILRSANTHVTWNLFSAWVVYVWRDVYPLGMFTFQPLDIGERWTMWIKFGLLSVAAMFVPLFLPAEYIPFDPEVCHFETRALCSTSVCVRVWPIQPERPCMLHWR